MKEQNKPDETYFCTYLRFSKGKFIQAICIPLFCLHDSVSPPSQELIESCDQLQVGRRSHIISAP